MTPRETTVTVRSGLWVTVDEWEASAKVTVSYKGKLLAAPRRIRLRDGKEGRLERFKAHVLTPANWPTRDGDQEEKWEKFLFAAQTLDGNAGHSMEAANACSTRWRGTVDLEGLRKDGFVGATTVVPAADAEILCGWAEEKADEAGLNTVHHLQGEDGTHSLFVIPESWKEKAVRENNGILPAGWAVAPQRWTPRKLTVRAALAGHAEEGERTSRPTVDVSAALERVYTALRERCGKPRSFTPLLELLISMPAKLLKPQPWHGDLLANPSLGAIVMLSERGVPPYFPAISKDWGEGRRIIASAQEGSGKRKAGKMKDKSEMEETSYYTARKMRWDRVHASKTNDGESVAALNACGGTIGTTTLGFASAGPRNWDRIGPIPVRKATGVRDTQARGDATFFDTTGPHRGPGKAAGDPAGRRVVLYCSWAKKAWEANGSPVYAFKPQGARKGSYQLAYSKDGEYKLAARAPGNAEELAASKKAKTQETWEKKRAMGAAAAVLASLASASPE
jgi:hypothetical protein